MAESLGTAVLDLRVDDSQFNRGLDGANTRLGGLGGLLGGTTGKVLAFSGVIGGAALAVKGISAAFSFVSDSAVGMNAKLETTELQFETLLGSADRARDHVAGLFEFAAETPFETEPIIEASKAMLAFGGEALATQGNLRLVGDAAAAVGAPINEVATWFGRAASAIQSGRPFGEAAQRLQELAILSPRARAEMEALQKSGASAADVWAVLERDFDRFGGAMQKQAASWQGLTSTIVDNVSLAAAEGFRPFFDLLKEGAQLTADFVQSADFQAWAQTTKSAMETAANGVRRFIGAVDDARDAIFNLRFLEAAAGLSEMNRELDVAEGRWQALGQGVRDARVAEESVTAAEKLSRVKDELRFVAKAGGDVTPLLAEIARLEVEVAKESGEAAEKVEELGDALSDAFVGPTIDPGELAGRLVDSIDQAIDGVRAAGITGLEIDLSIDKARDRLAELEKMIEATDDEELRVQLILEKDRLEQDLKKAKEDVRGVKREAESGTTIPVKADVEPARRTILDLFDEINAKAENLLLFGGRGRSNMVNEVTGLGQSGAFGVASPEDARKQFQSILASGDVGELRSFTESLREMISGFALRSGTDFNNPFQRYIELQQNGLRSLETEVTRALTSLERTQETGDDRRHHASIASLGRIEQGIVSLAGVLEENNTETRSLRQAIATGSVASSTASIIGAGVRLASGQRWSSR